MIKMTIERKHHKPNTQRRPFIIMLMFLSLLAFALSLSQISVDRFFRGTQEIHRILEIAYNIKEYNVILTSEAKLYAIDSDESHRKLYDETLILLEEAFTDIIEFDPSYADVIDEIDDANIKFVELEILAFELSFNHQNNEAISILLSEEYQSDKLVYSILLERLLENIKTTHEIRYTQLEDTLNINLLLIFSVFILIIVFLFFVYIVLERRMRFEQK